MRSIDFLGFLRCARHQAHISWLSAKTQTQQTHRDMMWALWTNRDSSTNFNKALNCCSNCSWSIIAETTWVLYDYTVNCAMFAPRSLAKRPAWNPIAQPNIHSPAAVTTTTSAATLQHPLLPPDDELLVAVDLILSDYAVWCDPSLGEHMSDGCTYCINSLRFYFYFFGHYLDSHCRYFS